MGGWINLCDAQKINSKFQFFCKVKSILTLEIQTNRTSQKRRKVAAFDNIQKTIYRQRKLLVTKVPLPLPVCSVFTASLFSHRHLSTTARWKFLNHMLHVTNSKKSRKERDKTIQSTFTY